MAQTAYDLNLFETGRQAKRKPDIELQVVKGGRSNPLGMLGVALVYIKWIVGAAILLSLVIVLLNSKSRVVELSVEINNTKKELANTQSELHYYTERLDSMTSLDLVESLARQHGLMKVEAGQITYVRLEDEGVIIREASPLSQWAHLLHTGAQDVVGFFDP